MSDLTFLEEQAQEEAPDALAQVMGLVTRWLDFAKRVKQAEAVLKAAKEKEARIREQDIPEMMRLNRLTSLSLDNGVLVTIEELVELSVPKEDPEKRKAALAWLAANGAGDLIKDTLTIYDPPSSLIAKLAEDGVEYARDKTVDSRSLKAWIKSALGMKKGSVAQFKPEDVAPELGLFRHYTTKTKGA